MDGAVLKIIGIGAVPSTVLVDVLHQQPSPITACIVDGAWKSLMHNQKLFCRAVHIELNEITVGWKNVKAFRSTLNTYLYERSQGIFWPLERLQSLGGMISYYNMVNAEWLNKILDVYNKKYRTSVLYCIKQDKKRR